MAGALSIHGRDARANFLSAAVMLMLALVASVFAATSTPAAPAKKKVVVPVIEVSGSISERRSAFALLEPESLTLRGLTGAVDKAASDPDVPSLIVHLDTPGWGFAQAMEFEQALMRFRESGKPLYIYANTLTLGSYVVATAGTEIIVPPVGGLDLYGMNFSLYYFKDLLAKVGIEADAVNTGRFKDAMEPFVSSEMSEGTKEQFTELLHDVFATARETVAVNRGIPTEEAEKLLTGGPYTSKKALELKAVDRVAYLDDLQDELDEKYAEDDFSFEYEYTDGPAKTPELPSLMSLLTGAGLKGGKKKGDATPKIALVYALGNIVDGRVDDSNPLSQENVIAGQDFVDLLDEVREEEGLKAIVLRVDSPGGSAVASDQIWKRLKEIQGEGVPIIVSMGNLAASGGYYISMGADRIVAEPTTITGSIGVIGGKFSLGGTYEKFGVVKRQISIGENVNIYSESTKWSEREKEILTRLLDDVYDQFTSKAAEGRGMAQEDLKELAEGRVWSGAAAKKNGLVDELGGLSRAIEIARELGDAPDAVVVEHPKELTLIEMIQKAFSGKLAIEARAPRAAVTENPAFQAASLIVPREHLLRMLFVVDQMKEGPRALVYSPWAFELK